ncbi:MAG: hypothetical protein Q9226_008924 [Calogaya cf. arnoldii]
MLLRELSQQVVNMNDHRVQTVWMEALATAAGWIYRWVEPRYQAFKTANLHLAQSHQLANKREKIQHPPGRPTHKDRVNKNGPIPFREFGEWTLTRKMISNDADEFISLEEVFANKILDEVKNQRAEMAEDFEYYRQIQTEDNQSINKV